MGEGRSSRLLQDLQRANRGLAFNICGDCPSPRSADAEDVYVSKHETGSVFRWLKTGRMDTRSLIQSPAGADCELVGDDLAFKCS